MSGVNLFDPFDTKPAYFRHMFVIPDADGVDKPVDFEALTQALNRQADAAERQTQAIEQLVAEIKILFGGRR